MLHLPYVLLVVLLALLPSGVPAQDAPLDFEYGTYPLRNSRPFAPPGASPLQERLKPFYHGVASGDPLADRVIIWTRVTPETLDGAPIEVSWAVATDPALLNTVRSGTFTTSESRDYTVKVDVTGLAAGTTYYYGFRTDAGRSLTGRTKTTPTNSSVDHLRFGVVSCSNYPAGYFNAYGHLAVRNDLDAVLHLGDYIYEFGNGNDADPLLPDRIMDGTLEAVELFEYRSRYGTYRLDSQLMHVHQQHPFIAVWDDHEYANNSYADGAQGHQPNNEGAWAARKAAAKQAYFEWMPIRDPDGTGIYRSVSYGNLVDLIMLDTRIEAREMQINEINDQRLYAADRTLLGAPQEQWLKQRMTGSSARWKLIGQQVMFSPFNIGWAGPAVGRSYSRMESMFLDIWDGYPAEREELIEFLREEDIDNTVILTGSFHSSVAYEVVDTPALISFTSVQGFDSIPRYAPAPGYDPATGAGAVAVEFITPSITSANFDETVGEGPARQLDEQINQPIRPLPNLDLGNPNPHMKYVDLLNHGYYLLDVTPDRVQADYYYSDILREGDPERFDAAVISDAGTHRLRTGTTESAGKARQDTPAPADPPGGSTPVTDPEVPQVLILSPNPVVSEVRFQYALPRPAVVHVELYDATGRRVRVLFSGRQTAGIYTLVKDLTEVPSGSYFLRLRSEEGSSAHPLIKR